jgi:signal transduction histidine kinase
VLLREITTMPKVDNQSLELLLFLLVAIAMVVQAAVFLAAFLAMRKAAHTMNEKIDDMRTHVMPLVDTTRELMTKLAPRIESASDDMATIAHSLRVQGATLQAAADEILERARSQAGRLDTMLTSLFDAVDRAGDFMADCINKPIRQFSALLASARAAIESFRTTVPAPRSQSNHAPGEDMFI